MNRTSPRRMFLTLNMAFDAADRNIVVCNTDLKLVFHATVEAYSPRVPRKTMGVVCAHDLRVPYLLPLAVAVKTVGPSVAVPW